RPSLIAHRSKSRVVACRFLRGFFLLLYVNPPFQPRRLYGGGTADRGRRRRNRNSGGTFEPSRKIFLAGHSPVLCLHSHYFLVLRPGGAGRRHPRPFVDSESHGSVSPSGGAFTGRAAIPHEQLNAR